MRRLRQNATPMFPKSISDVQYIYPTISDVRYVYPTSDDITALALALALAEVGYSISDVRYICCTSEKRNQYVGQTQRNLSKRIAGHRAASKIKTNLPIYKHFHTRPNHNFHRDIKVTILEKTTREQLITREKFWINALDTAYPNGLNSKFDLQ